MSGVERKVVFDLADRTARTNASFGINLPYYLPSDLVDFQQSHSAIVSQTNSGCATVSTRTTFSGSVAQPTSDKRAPLHIDRPKPRINCPKALLKRAQNSAPSMFVWFTLIACDAVYFSCVWPQLVYLVNTSTRPSQGNCTASMAILLAVHVYFLLAIVVNLCLSTCSDPGRLPPTVTPTTVEPDSSYVVVNVLNQLVELKWCAVRTE